MIERAGHALAALIAGVDVNHRGRRIAAAERF